MREHSNHNTKQNARIKFSVPETRSPGANKMHSHKKTPTKARKTTIAQPIKVAGGAQGCIPPPFWPTRGGVCILCSPCWPYLVCPRLAWIRRGRQGMHTPRFDQKGGVVCILYSLCWPYLVCRCVVFSGQGFTISFCVGFCVRRIPSERSQAKVPKRMRR